MCYLLSFDTKYNIYKKKIKKQTNFQNNVQSSAFMPRRSPGHETVITNYGFYFIFFKSVKNVVTNYGFRSFSAPFPFRLGFLSLGFCLLIRHSPYLWLHLVVFGSFLTQIQYFPNFHFVLLLVM